MNHYFTNSEDLKSNIKEFKVKFLNYEFSFKTDNGVFSKREIDYGTKLLIETLLKYDLKGSMLDLGCGYGVIGITLAKLKNLSCLLIDVNKRAVHLANMNIKDNNLETAKAILSDGFNNILDTKFDIIVSNPPIRVGKEKLYELIKNCKNHLSDNGYIYLVIRKEQGAKSFIRDFSDIYKIEVLNKSQGFYVISLKSC